MNSQEFKLLKEIIRGIPELVFVVSENGEYLEIGGISEHNPDDIVGRSLAELFPDDITRLFENALHDAFSDTKASIKTLEYQLSPSEDLKITLQNNETRTFELKINPLSVTFGGIRIAVCICRDISDLRKYEQMLVKLSERDPLTGVYNRTKLLERLNASFETYLRYNTPTSFMLLDLDNFKIINDKYGHQAGDKAICHFATLCEKEHRIVDTFARYGGDEFGLIMPNITRNEAVSFAERIWKQVTENIFTYEGNTIPISVSIGVSEIDQNDKSIETIILKADQAMYKSKNREKSSISLPMG